MKREPYLIGNWKMHKTARESADFLETLAPLVGECQVNILLAVSFTSVSTMAHLAKNTSIVIGAQNVHESREGAFTGEISSIMLKEAGARFVLIGHSERRTLFGENDERVRAKIIRALSDDLIPVLCIGEEATDTEEILKKQLDRSLDGISKKEVEKLLIAYEPVWAIGTGKSATAARAQETHAYIRSVVQSLFGKPTAHHIPILYGGSVSQENAKGFMQQPDIDGLLVGGASLNPETFAVIAKTIN